MKSPICTHNFRKDYDMLWLSRRNGQKIIVTTPEGRRIEITRGERFGGKVRIGIKADSDVAILQSPAIIAGLCVYGFGWRDRLCEANKPPITTGRNVVRARALVSLSREERRIAAVASGASVARA